MAKTNNILKTVAETIIRAKEEVFKTGKCNISYLNKDVLVEAAYELGVKTLSNDTKKIIAQNIETFLFEELDDARKAYLIRTAEITEYQENKRKLNALLTLQKAATVSDENVKYLKVDSDYEGEAVDGATHKFYKMYGDNIIDVLKREEYIIVYSTSIAYGYKFNTDKCNKLFKTVHAFEKKNEQTQQQPQSKSAAATDEIRLNIDNEDIKFLYTYLKNNKYLYVPTKLHGNLKQFNGKYFTMKSNNLYRAVRAMLARKNKVTINKVTNNHVREALNALVKGKVVKAIAIEDSVTCACQYFITGTANWFMNQMGFEGNFFEVEKPVPNTDAFKTSKQTDDILAQMHMQDDADKAAAEKANTDAVKPEDTTAGTSQETEAGAAFA